MVGSTPSENEWLIMEVLWDHEGAMTAAEIIEKIKEIDASKGIKDTRSMNKNTIKVMINRLLGKKLIAHYVDEKDLRVYHYHPTCTREECQSLKSERFVNNYFGGNTSLAVASFLRSADISREQLDALKSLVEELEEKTDQK